MTKHSLVWHEMTPGIDYIKSRRLIPDKAKSRIRKFWKSVLRVRRHAATTRDFIRDEIFIRLINAIAVDEIYDGFYFFDLRLYRRNANAIDCSRCKVSSAAGYGRSR